ncbi:MAG: amidohydrolase [Hyphomicrobiales bacterium]|nr:amidohydrolase [Hyphomicrobiales bacterium]
MPSADLIITNARILTMNKQALRAESLAIAGNRILAVGSNADMKALKGSHTRVIDAQMNTVMPGIVESHIHLFGGAVELDSLIINNIKGLSVVSAAIREYAAANPKDRIIIVNGAAPVSLGDTTAITRQVLDTIIADRPLALICFDHHTVWANTRALEAGGLLQGASLTPGNEIVMGSDGLATGELREAAAFAPLLGLTATGGREWLGMVTGENPVPPATAAERLIDQNFMKRGLEYCASLGITSIHNMDGNWYQLELLKALMDRDELIARVEVPFHQKNFFETSRVDEAVEMRHQYQGDMLHSGRVKIFMDGVLESLTALMLEDYPGYPGNRGAPLFTAEQFNEVATRADKHGLQISVHAIGDGGVRRTLDGYETARKANGIRDSRHRIEHIELIDKADIPRLKELGVIASLQPIVGLGVPGNPPEPCRTRIGDKLPQAYAWQTLRETGATVAFSSDWPVSPLDPFLGIQSAMTSLPLSPESPPQAQSLMDTLDSFTAAGAYTEFAEAKKGKLMPGMLADVIILNGNIEATPAAQMSTLKPVLTICDGRITFEP